MSSTCPERRPALRLASSFALAAKQKPAPGQPAGSDFLTSTAGAMSGLRVSTSFPPSQSCDQWLSSPTRESVTRYRGATVPDSHGVPAPPTVFETVPASREAGASRNGRDMGVSPGGFQILISGNCRGRPMLIPPLSRELPGKETAPPAFAGICAPYANARLPVSGYRLGSAPVHNDPEAPATVPTPLRFPGWLGAGGEPLRQRCDMTSSTQRQEPVLRFNMSQRGGQSRGPRPKNRRKNAQFTPR